ncbi:MAG: hypothetical protein U9N80_08305 [Chloroflexota bacterium]|nr:hypothetical protein [Chloroflexota bacterium]
MGKEIIKDRCEICIFFIPEDKFKHIQKNLKARKPEQSSAYDQTAKVMGYDEGSSSDIGTCTQQNGKTVNDNDLCDQFSHDISKNY